MALPKVAIVAPHPDDVAGVKRWFQTLERHVRDVDYIGARPIFAADLIAFGTFTDFMIGQAAAEKAQWRNVWENIDDFTWRADIRAIVSPDRRQAVGMGIFDSTGYLKDATPYDRAGRATVVLVRDSLDAPWLAQHTHLSLFRNVPTQSFKGKPEKLGQQA
jgi:ketosteroid isomerase-like protein